MTQGRTILTGEMSETTKAELAAERRAVEIARDHILPNFLAAYRSGELTFEKFCRSAIRALKPLEQFPRLNATRQRLLGAVVEEAGAISPTKHGPGRTRQQTWLRQTSLDLIRLVRRHEHLPVNKISIDKSGKSAFVRVAEIFKQHGVTVSASRVQYWYDRKNKE